MAAGGWFCVDRAAGQADPVQQNIIAESLDAAGLTAAVDDDGDFRLLINLGEGRSQLVYINTRTVTLGPYTIREIWSPALMFSDGIDADLARELLEENNRLKLGAWCLQPVGDKTAAVFKVKVAAEAVESLNDLRTLLDIVARTADALERRKPGYGQ
jgi:hypothetical protein